MLVHQRQWAYGKFRELLAECSGNEFEGFFHRLMELCHDDYVPVRTHGDIGDMSADGLGLRDRKLYACYAPETIDPGEIRKKFRKDLRGAVTQRPEQFDTFVFVHNDRRGGIHPVVSGLLVEAQTAYPSIGFQQMGQRKLWDRAVRLDKVSLEQLLGVPEIPIEEARYGIGMAELEPLLEHLRVGRCEAPPNVSLAPPSSTKLAFNELGPDCVEAIRRGTKHSWLIDKYYDDLLGTVEHDEVAASFTAYYRQVRSEQPESPDDVMYAMEVYVLGNLLPKLDRIEAAHVVLAHFFERCDIFERPPAGWTPSAAGRDA